jgi:hypothetical protein
VKPGLKNKQRSVKCLERAKDCFACCAAGSGGIMGAQVAMYVRTLAMVYSNLTAPNLPMATGPSDIPYLKEVRLVCVVLAVCSCHC